MSLPFLPLLLPFLLRPPAPEVLGRLRALLPLPRSSPPRLPPRPAVLGGRLPPRAFFGAGRRPRRSSRSPSSFWKTKKDGEVKFRLATWLAQRPRHRTGHHARITPTTTVATAPTATTATKERPSLPSPIPPTTASGHLGSPSWQVLALALLLLVLLLTLLLVTLAIAPPSPPGTASPATVSARVVAVVVPPAPSRRRYPLPHVRRGRRGRRSPHVGVSALYIVRIKATVCSCVRACACV